MHNIIAKIATKSGIDLSNGEDAIEKFTKLIVDECINALEEKYALISSYGQQNEISNAKAMAFSDAIVLLKLRFK